MQQYYNNNIILVTVYLFPRVRSTIMIIHIVFDTHFIVNDMYSMHVKRYYFTKREVFATARARGATNTRVGACDRHGNYMCETPDLNCMSTRPNSIISCYRSRISHAFGHCRCTRVLGNRYSQDQGAQFRCKIWGCLSPRKKKYYFKYRQFYLDLDKK